MGSCYKCGTQITLKEEEVSCDICGKLLRYWCHNCNKSFDIIDKKTLDKLSECSICGYFYCPNCGICGDVCSKKEWSKRLKIILDDGVFIINGLSEKIKKIVDFIEEIKSGKEQRNCTYGVPISYAKNRIKSIIVRMEGYRVKNLDDQEAFKQRYEEILDKDIGEQFTVKGERDNGTYGQEYRDAFNLGICMGKIKVIWKLNKIGEDYCVYERVNGTVCNNLSKDKLIIAECLKCGKVYEKGKTNCIECVYLKGDKKGMLYRLKIKISNKDVCQLPRVEFKKRENG